MAERVAVICWKSPYPIRGGLDLRIDGICRTLSSTKEVVLICMEGEQSAKPEYVSELYLAPRSNKLLNHEILKWGFENPTDPLGIFVNKDQVQFLRKILDSVNPRDVIVSRIMMWRIYREANFHPKFSQILDLDESSNRLYQAFLGSISKGPHIKFISNFHKRNIEYEKTAISEADYVLVSSEIEKLECLKYKSNEQLVVVENIVDVESQEERNSSSNKRVIFPGNFDYLPNREALKEILQFIAPCLPDFHFTIAGSGSLKNFPQLSNVEYIIKPESMKKLFISSDYLIAPLRFGAGTRLKVLEAMSLGSVVIATKFAVEGILVDPGTHYFQAETPVDFINGLEKLGEDSRLRSKLRGNAREFVKRAHSSKSIDGKLRKIL